MPSSTCTANWASVRARRHDFKEEELNTTIDNLRRGIQDSITTKQKMLADERLLGTVATVIDVIVAAPERGNTGLFAGNGGSAADAQHLAAEFVSRFEFDRPGLPSLSLS